MLWGAGLSVQALAGCPLATLPGHVDPLLCTEKQGEGWRQRRAERREKAWARENLASGGCSQAGEDLTGGDVVQSLMSLPAELLCFGHPMAQPRSKGENHVSSC